MPNHKILSDGASVPSFERRRIVRVYGVDVMERLDWCGRRHDYRREKNMNRTQARLLMVIDMHGQILPPELIERVQFGLWIYDHAPTPIRWALKKTTPKNKKLVTLEI